LSSHWLWARAASEVSVSVGRISSARFFLAWSMLISDVAMRRFTTLSLLVSNLT
jgi:hypothetical protein